MPRPSVGLPPELEDLPGGCRAAGPTLELPPGGCRSAGQVLELLRESKEELSRLAQRAEARLRYAEQCQRSLEALKLSWGGPNSSPAAAASPPLAGAGLLPEQPFKSQWSGQIDDVPRLNLRSMGGLGVVEEKDKERSSEHTTRSATRSKESTGGLERLESVDDIRKDRSAFLAPPDPLAKAWRRPERQISDAACSQESGAAGPLWSSNAFFSGRDEKVEDLELQFGQEEEQRKATDIVEATAQAAARRLKFAQDRHNIISRDLERLANLREPFFTRLIHSKSFDTCVAMLILLNAFFMGMQVDYGDVRQHSVTLLVGSIAFSTIFVLELFLRVLGDGLLWWLQEPPWNMIDTAVTVCSVVELALRLSTWPALDGSSNMAIFRTLRMLRFVRAARVLRVMHFFRELRLMVFSISHSLRSIFWALVLLMMTTFMFGISLAQGVRDATQENYSEEVFVKLQVHFGSVTRTMFTLFQAVLGGFSWAELTDRLRQVGWVYEFLFCSFIAFTVLALLNVVTGVFVDGALRSAAQDRDIAIQDQVLAEGSYATELRKLFCEADVDDSGSLTLDEFLQYLKDDRVQSYLRALGIDSAEAEGLFHLLDLDDSGSIETEEFIAGCLRFKGEAKGVDVFMLMYENKRMVLAIITALDAIAADIKVMRSANTGRRPSARVSVGSLYRRINTGVLPSKSYRSAMSESPRQPRSRKDSFVSQVSSKRSGL